MRRGRPRPRIVNDTIYSGSASGLGIFWRADVLVRPCALEKRRSRTHRPPENSQAHRGPIRRPKKTVRKELAESFVPRAPSPAELSPCRGFPPLRAPAAPKVPQAQGGPHGCMESHRTRIIGHPMKSDSRRYSCFRRGCRALVAALILIIGVISYNSAFAADAPKTDPRYPFRTDFANADLPWYKLKPGEFPPHHSDRRIGGELVIAGFHSSSRPIPHKQNRRIGRFHHAALRVGELSSIPTPSCAMCRSGRSSCFS